MSIATEISRIQTDRNTIRAKLVELGMATSTDNLTKLADAVEGIANQGEVSATVRDGETYTIPAGYHNGSGTVSGVQGGGNYSLQSKNATPTKKQQSITPDSGFYGLSDVTVSAIPDNYQDVSSVTAAAGEVLTGKVIVTSDGTVTTGTMANNGAVSKVLSASESSYTVPKGYHSGTGNVRIVTETKAATPTKSAQDITPTTGAVLSKVTVAAIPAAYQDVTNVDAGADDVLAGKIIVSATGEEIEGTMTNNGAKTASLNAGGSYTIPAGYHNGSGKVTAASLASQTSATATATAILSGATAWVNGSKVTGTMPDNGPVGDAIDGLTKTSVTIPGGFTTGGTVSLSSAIEDALSAI